MSSVWLGTIGPAYGNEEFWVTAFERQVVEDILREELIDEWGHSQPIEFDMQSGNYFTYHNKGDKADIRNIALFDYATCLPGCLLLSTRSASMQLSQR